MRHLFLGVVIPAMIACSPTYNWREIRMDDTNLMGMLPCKPDTGSRVLPLGGREVEIHMTGCDAGGATFAIARADLKDAVAVPAVLAQWRAATLLNMGASRTVETPMAVSAATQLPPLVVVSAQGKRRDGSAVTMRGIWYSRGTQVFHAVVYADPEADVPGKANRTDPIEPFFSGLRFQ